jgi:predicted PurR-regulated permease PerM
LIPGVLGFLVGAGLFAATWKDIFPKISQFANLGNTILPELWNVSSTLMALVFVEFTLFLFYLLERKIGQRVDKMAADK